MPAWNAARTIREAIASVLDQRSAAQFDIIVVDDGSTDATREIVAEIAGSASEVRLITRARAGVSATRNAALAAVTADTDVVTFLDADDLSPPDRFLRDLPAFVNNDAVDVHWGMTLMFAADATTQQLRDRPQRGSHLGAVMIKTATLRTIGRFDETLPIGEDVDFLIRMLEAQPRLMLIYDVALLYRRHATNMSLDTDLVRKALTRVYLAAAYRRKHGAAAVPVGLFRPYGEAR